MLFTLCLYLLKLGIGKKFDNNIVCLLLQVLQNDIHAHEQSIDSVRKACQNSMGIDKSSASRRKYDDLNKLWDKVQDKSERRQQELENSLKEVCFKFC